MRPKRPRLITGFAKIPLPDNEANWSTLKTYNCTLAAHHKRLLSDLFQKKRLLFSQNAYILAFCLQNAYLHRRKQDVFLDDFRQGFDFLIGKFLEETAAAFRESNVVLLHEKNELRSLLVRHINDIPHT